ncbi:MAG: hypothetical protein H6812_01245 [Phycisphaeraceae bacterium]|nr:hypothetical protein [Phycisphaeraceae bacterium]
MTVVGSYRALISSVVARVDPGWMYLCAGSAIVVASVLIPANHDLAESRAHRDRAIVSADYAARRVARYSDFLESLDSGDETVMTNLAATQLNLVPASKTPLFMLRSSRPDDANVFHDIEPPPPIDFGTEVASPRQSTLEWLVTSDSTRPWAVIGGMLCVLIGLLPAAEHKAESAEPV